MIRYAMKCTRGHQFESWFQSAAAFDRLAGAGHLACPDCGDVKVVKSLMAPQVRPARTVAAAMGAAAVGSERDSEGGVEGGAANKRPAAAGPLTTPANPAEMALAALRRHVEQTADYVGTDFTTEARRIHEGATPERPIWGEARIEDARALVDEGINVAPLPFRPTRKSH